MLNAAEGHPFLELTLDRVQQNLFRLLELPAPSAFQLLRRRLRELSLQAPEVLTMKYNLLTEDAAFQLKAWERRLSIPEELWVDEWFTPWGSDDAELHALSIADRAYTAEERWNRDPNNPVLLHDLAIARFCEAIDLEVNRKRPESDRSEQRRRSAWESVIECWSGFLSPNSEFWVAQDARIRGREDPRLNIFLTHHSRRPIILLPDWALAVVWTLAQRQKLTGRAERLKALRDSYRARVVEAGHIPGPEVWTLAIPELETRKNVLLSMIQSANSDFTEADLSTRTWPIRELETIAVKYFDFVNRTLPEGQPERYELLKSLVEALRDLLIRFGNGTREWQATETFFELLLRYAPSDQTKEKIAQDIETIASIKLDQAHESSFRRMADLATELPQASDLALNEVCQMVERFLQDVAEEVFYLEQPRISDPTRLVEAKDRASRAVVKLLRSVVSGRGFDAEVYELGAKAERLASGAEAKLETQGFLNELKYMN